RARAALRRPHARGDASHRGRLHGGAARGQAGRAGRGGGSLEVRVLIVKLSSLGDVVHTMPVVHDIRAAHPEALIDWVVEPGFAPLVRRVHGIHSSIECALRRWRKGWWTREVRREWQLFRDAMRGERYDAVIDFQGLT